MRLARMRDVVDALRQYSGGPPPKTGGIGPFPCPMGVYAHWLRTVRSHVRPAIPPAPLGTPPREALPRGWPGRERAATNARVVPFAHHQNASQMVRFGTDNRFTTAFERAFPNTAQGPWRTSKRLHWGHWTRLLPRASALVPPPPPLPFPPAAPNSGRTGRRSARRALHKVSCGERRRRRGAVGRPAGLELSGGSTLDLRRPLRRKWGAGLRDPVSRPYLHRKDPCSPQLCPYTHVYTYTCMRVYVYTTYTRLHPYTHMRTRAYTHIRMYMRIHM